MADFKALTIDQGGTNATTASDARTELGVAYGTTAGTVLEGSKDALYAKLLEDNNFIGTQTTKGNSSTTSGQFVATDGSGFLRGVILESANGTAGTVGRLRVVNTSGDLGIGTRDYNDAIRILGSNGNVGIGTTIPGARLDLEATSGDLLELNGTGTNNTIMRLRSDGTEVGALYVLNNDTDLNLRSNGAMRLMTNGAITRVFIDETTGNVGINTTNPGSKFSVVGLPTSSAGLASGDQYTQTASQLGGSGTTKVVCIV